MLILIATQTQRRGYMNLFIREFPDDVHREMKIQAAVEGISIKALVIQAVKDYLKKKKK
jgi:plasmid stability protein